MRRINICEERGSGVDKIIQSVEIFQLPAPEFIADSEHTKIILFAHKNFAAMTIADRIRACYQHTCLRYVSREPMTNSSLKQRFNVDTSTVSRVIKSTLETKLIKTYDPASNSKKTVKYVPFGA